MPALLLPLLGKMLSCKPCLYVMVIVAAIGAGWLYVRHLESNARAEVIAEMQAATAKEHDRRVAVENYMQQWAAGAVSHVSDLQSQISQQKARNARLSAANDRRVCLDADAADRVRRSGH